jgi:hypothetical protein
MNAREIVSWCLAGLFALAAVAGWEFYLGEWQARAAEREQWRANLQLLESHALRGMMLEAERAKDQAQALDSGSGN